MPGNIGPQTGKMGTSMFWTGRTRLFGETLGRLEGWLADGQWRAAGESGMALVVTGKGETMRGAREQAYSRIEDVIVPNLYYRDDVGERWVDGDRLQAWGYLGPD